MIERKKITERMNRMAFPISSGLLDACVLAVLAGGDAYGYRLTQQLRVQPLAVIALDIELLRLLLQHPGTVFSPKRIYRAVWGEEPYGVENAVAVHIRHLREKLEIVPSDPRYIKVVWGQGYKIDRGDALNE